MRKSSIAAATAASAFAFVLIAPGQAAAVDTPLTFGVTGGDLTIAAPSATQTLTVNGLTASGSVAPVVVTDARRGINGWTAKALSSQFVKSDAATVVIPASAVTYQAGLATITGIAVVTPNLTPVVIDTTKTIQTATAVIGANTASWSGTVNVTLPPDVQAGTYNGILTHSVA